MANATLASAWAKKARGDALTKAEEQALREYHRQAVAVSTRIYWDSPKQKADLEAMAEKVGSKNFSKWLIHQIERGVNASTVTRSELERLQQEVETANRRFDQEAENSVFFREQARRFERERDDLQIKLTKLEEQLAEMLEKLERRSSRGASR